MRQPFILRRMRADRGRQVAGKADFRLDVASDLPAGQETFRPEVTVGDIYRAYRDISRKDLVAALATKAATLSEREDRLDRFVQSSRGDGGSVTCESMAQLRYVLQQAQFELMIVACDLVLASHRAHGDMKLAFNCPPLEPYWCPPEDEAVGDRARLTTATDESGVATPQQAAPAAPPPSAKDQDAASKARKP